MIDGDLYGEAEKIFFHSLMSFLQTSAKLEKVTVSCSTGYLRCSGHHPYFGTLYPLARICALFDCHFESFDPAGPGKIGKLGLLGPPLSKRLQSCGDTYKEFYKKNFFVRMLYLNIESSYCQTHANLLQLNSDERNELRDCTHSIPRARLIVDIEREKVFADRVEQLETLLDRIFARTKRAQIYAIDLGGESAEDILSYREAHSERVLAFRAENLVMPRRCALRLYISDIKDARDYWEKDARRGRWYGLGLEGKFEEIESGLRKRRGKNREVIDQGC